MERGTEPLSRVAEAMKFLKRTRITIGRNFGNPPSIITDFCGIQGGGVVLIVHKTQNN
jgi:hypothetical protein